MSQSPYYQSTSSFDGRLEQRPSWNDIDKIRIVSWYQATLLRWGLSQDDLSSIIYGAQGIQKRCSTFTHELGQCKVSIREATYQFVYIPFENYSSSPRSILLPIYVLYNPSSRIRRKRFGCQSRTSDTRRRFAPTIKFSCQPFQNKSFGGITNGRAEYESSQ